MDAERLFTETKQGFGFYHKNFGVPYAFGKYDQLFVPEFNAGAMENAGAVTFLEDYVFRSKVTRASYERRAETVLHEMAHMWFGDLVTMQWWDDLWLNESFATFASVLCQAEATEFTEAWTTFANVEKSWAYRQDQLPSTHPVAADIPDLARRRGQLRRHHLRQGRQRAQAAGRLRRAGGVPVRACATTSATTPSATPRSATCSARWRRRRAATCRDWGQQWLKTTGLNTLRADFDVDADGTFTRFAIDAERRRARRRRDPGAPPGGRHLRRRRHAASWSAPTARSSTSTARARMFLRCMGVSRGKLILVNDDDLTYCSLRLDPESLQTALDPHRRHRRPAAPHAGVVGGVGDDPRCR